jgi:ceramide glucosyltransferase
MFVELFLALWCAVGIAWDGYALFLVARASRHAPTVSPDAAGPTEKLSVFKPLPPLEADGLRGMAAGLESFIGQLGPEDDLLLGIHDADRDRIAPFLEKMKSLYPGARLKPIFRSSPDDVANPKIAWLKILAGHAEGALWLWSDADIIAPPGFLRGARAEFAAGGATMVTFPYVVREIEAGPALLDALFVNFEFYPGLLLLRARGLVDFGLGAGLLFRRDDFQRRADWTELGAALADDFVLGQQLGPVRIGTSTLATTVEQRMWKEALLHYLRWSRTIAWNRPAGWAARVVILPVLGLALDALLHPANGGAWVQLALMMQIEILFAVGICAGLGCRFRFRDVFALESWPLWRVLTWVICLLPGRVTWSGKTWHGPRLASGRREGH